MASHSAWLRLFIGIILASLLCSCNSNGSYEEDSEIEGTGIHSNGVIDGFGSVILNDTHFNTDYTQVFINGEPAEVADLKLGYYVEVEGSKSNRNNLGEADVITYYDKVLGKINRAPFVENGVDYMEILGQKVQLDATTLYENTTFATLQVFDIVAVSGFDIDNNTVFATRIEKKPDGHPIVVEGVVDYYYPTEDMLLLENYHYLLKNATVIGDRSQLSQGAYVRIIATYTLGSRTLNAQKVTISEPFYLKPDLRYELEGLVQQRVSPHHFAVSNIDIDATQAEFIDSNPDQLNEDSWVLVSGYADSQGQFIAETLRIYPDKGFVPAEVKIQNDSLE